MPGQVQSIRTKGKQLKRKAVFVMSTNTYYPHPRVINGGLL